MNDVYIYIYVFSNNPLCHFVTKNQNVKSTWHIMQEYWHLQECGSILRLLDILKGSVHFFKRNIAFFR